MSPTLRAGQIVIASGQFKNVAPGQVVIIYHTGLEKIKRISQVDTQKGIFVLGDNAAHSTDSRVFGWLDFDEVIAKVIWPRSRKTTRP